ncbi:hypothetical protein V3C99_003070 [Haemonchus contortus]|uniref:BACK domain-containing protein n=1 Tax=Haemonchus contortus TaxID=6289 RepID=A0A7I4Y895_HAECO|nr:Hypothetical protein CBG12166 [Haemonchus contortus]
MPNRSVKYDKKSKSEGSERRRGKSDSSDRSQSRRRSKSEGRRSRRSSRSQSESRRNRNTIKLIYKKGHRYVKIVDFVAVSQLIKQHQVTGRVPRSIDLTDYYDTTITIFADYIEKGTVKARISFYALAELLKLTKTFVMDDLQRHLEETLILTAEMSTDHLIQAVLVAGTSNITKETENALHYLAAWSFVEMAALPDYQRIPYHQFVMLLASCELRVPHELVAADAALLWLVGQPHPAVYAPGVFAVIRSAYLSKVDRQLIVERIATLQMPESVARFAQISMESRHSMRVCLEAIHINRHLCRCGIPDPENRPKETSLPLSRPREGIKWSEKKLERQEEKQQKSRSRRSRRRSKRSSTRDRQRRKKDFKGKVKKAFSKPDSESDKTSRKSRKSSKRTRSDSSSRSGKRMSRGDFKSGESRSSRSRKRRSSSSKRRETKSVGDEPSDRASTSSSDRSQRRRRRGTRK